jgi:hypothetical protein
MTIRRFASLLIACGLLAPAAPLAFAEDKPAAADPPKSEKADDKQGQDDGSAKSDAKEEQKPLDPQQRAIQVAALDAKSSELLGKLDYEGAYPLLLRLVQLLEDPDRVKAVGEKARVAKEKLEEAGKDVAEIGARSVEKILAQPTGGAPPSDEERKPHPAPSDGKPYQVTIQELGNFRFDQDKGGNIPKDVQALSGATVRLSGYMIPLDQADKIKQFVLVPDLFACCFGQPPQVQHSVIVTCPEGKAVGYFPDQIQVEGKLSVEEKKDDGYIISIFEVACTSVKPAPK